jgi:hypothetical protein
MIEIFCALIAGVSAIVVAVVGSKQIKREKTFAETKKENDDAAKKRADDNLLMLQMLNAVCDLVIGTAQVLCKGSPECREELKGGLEAVGKAQGKYQEFRDKLASEQVAK